MDGMLMLILAVLAIIVFGVPIFVLLYRASFKNKVRIARQTGNDINDVIWLEDKFKVVNPDGNWVIKFLNMKEQTTSVPGNLWVKFAKNSKQELKFSKDEWKSKQMSANVARGLVLYENTEGEFFPMTISKVDGTVRFGLLNHNNRQFAVNEIRRAHDLTRNKTVEKILVIAAIVAIVGLVITGGIVTYFIGRENEKSIGATAQVCSAYAMALYNVSNGKPNTFLSDVAKQIGG